MEKGARMAKMPTAHKSHSLSLIVPMYWKAKPLPGSST